MCGGKACGRCTIPYGAASRCAAVQLAFASRGPIAKNSALHCFLNTPADGAPGNKTCERFRLRVFFCVMCDGKVCAWCTIPYGAGSCCAAVRLAFASRGPVAKNSAPHCFLNAPADGAPRSKDLRTVSFAGLFLRCVRRKGSSGGAEPHPYDGPRECAHVR